ncbi:MAG: hypothetical protein JXA67_14705, partial [Micromonosporaceae bacterium]|nr:hypothetical protein [Micromonosporaceae bacterium]
VAAPEAGTPVCTITDPLLRELSGLVALGSGYVTINDSNGQASRMRIYYLNARCELTRSVRYPTTARDPEDLALGPDGSLWVADVGDNLNAQNHRSTVAVWRLAPGAKSPVIHRLTYPDGNHDCEAMVIDGDGLPVLITKEVAGSAGIYQPSRPLEAQTEQGVPLKLLGRFSPSLTTTSNPFGVVGRFAVTGAAMAPDRSRLVVRTYADAYEFDVSGGDVVRALTSGKHRVTPLPDEPQGEAIAYTVDGSAFLTVSDTDAQTSLLRYRPAGRGEDAPAASSAASADPSSRSSVDASGPGTVPSSGQTETSGSTPRRLSVVGGGGAAIAAVGMVFVALALGLMIRRRRS